MFEKEKMLKNLILHINEQICEINKLLEARPLLSQNDESIVIHPELIKGLFKEIIKHQPEAQGWLDRKFKN